jgi:hypothetical protein
MFDTLICSENRNIMLFISPQPDSRAGQYKPLRDRLLFFNEEQMLKIGRLVA